MIWEVCWDGLWTLSFGLSQFHGHGCKVYTDSYMALKGSCCPVTRIIFKNHLLEVGLTHNRETANTRSRWFILFYHVWGPVWIKIHWNSISLRARHRRHPTTFEDPWPHYMILEVCWDGFLDTFFWALTFSWSRLLARVSKWPLDPPNTEEETKCNIFASYGPIPTVAIRMTPCYIFCGNLLSC